jgi:hypothetical protein
MQTVGSRAQVWHGTAQHTSGGLTKKNLIKNKWGRIVSAKKHKTAKKQKRLEKAGFFAKKGEFGVVKRETMRGGGMCETAMPVPAMQGNSMGGTSTSAPAMNGGEKRGGSRRTGKNNKSMSRR